jgi:Tol biopolymer transport system component
VDVARAAFPGANGLIAAELGFRPDRCQAVDRVGWLVTMRPDGSALRRLTNCRGRPRLEEVSSPDWSPTGRRLLFATGLGMVVMSADGSRWRVVTSRAQAGGEPSFAPDGRRFAYVHEGSIWSARIDGRGRRRLAAGFSPRWSPNGRTIAYKDRTGAVRLANARTGKRIRRLGLARGDALDWSPDGRRLLFEPQCCGPGYVIVRADGRGRSHALEWPDGVPGDAVFSPDGHRIAMVSSEGEGESVRHSIWTMTVRGTAKRRIYRSRFIDSEETGSPQLTWGPSAR